MKRLLTTLAALAVIGGALAACATATPYQARAPGTAQTGGYSEIRLEPDRWRVTFAGNSLTSRETVESYLLYRAAELTVNEGDDWFVAADRHTDKDTTYSYEADPFYRSHFYLDYGFGWRPAWRYHGGFGWRAWDPWGPDPFWSDQMDVREINRYEATTEIVMGKGPKPAGDPRAFDARAVLANLGPTIMRPKP